VTVLLHVPATASPQENPVLGTVIDLPIVCFIIGIAPWLFVGGVAAFGAWRKL
jgi:hypothetical protein